MRYLLLIFLFANLLSCKGQNDKKMQNQKHKYTNDLIKETSPYLLQHAHNPVNWHAWNKESLALAKKENKLIIISIGYSSCHWCHVMEHESFENEEVAKVMNANFISIKVDREERPDIDQVYMNAVQLMTGRGGWPLNCIALPNGRPIWGGTYFPKKNWINALTQLANLYKEDPEKAKEYADKLTEGVKNSSLIQFNNNEISFELNKLKSTVTHWTTHLDLKLGGSNGAPKFPMPNNLNFLLRYGNQANNSEIKNYVNTTLTNMAFGGIFDQIEGGFSRYSTDQKWHIPHFEKMLYDNGQLVSLYAKAYQATKNKTYKNVVYKTLQFIANELTSKEGAFYSSLDADSYGLWEHQNYVLIRKQEDKDFSKNHHLTDSELDNKVKEWHKKLLKIRNKRAKPRLDDKSLTSWNALMLKGYIDAYQAFDDPQFLEVALKNAQFIVNKQINSDGGLNHSYKNGKSTINGYLEDYATVIDAFIDLYQVTLNEKWLTTAKQLTDYTFDHFLDEKTHMFYFTSNKDTALITRKFEIEDNVIPASNSIMANNLFVLSHYYSNNYYLKVSKQMLSNVYDKVEDYGGGYSNWLNLLSNYVGPYYEIAISGNKAKEKIKAFNATYIPNKLFAGTTHKGSIPLMEGRDADKETLIYICVDGACQLPVKETKKALEFIKTTF